MVTALVCRTDGSLHDMNLAFESRPEIQVFPPDQRKDWGHIEYLMIFNIITVTKGCPTLRLNKPGRAHVYSLLHIICPFSFVVSSSSPHPHLHPFSAPKCVATRCFRRHLRMRSAWLYAPAWSARHLDLKTKYRSVGLKAASSNRSNASASNSPSVPLIPPTSM